MKVAKERKSSVLASNAVHHRIDSLTSIVALVAIGGSHFLHNAAWLDPVGGLIVSLMVIRAGWGNTGSALLELADIGVDDEMRNSVRRAATKALAVGDANGTPVDQMEVRDIQGVKAGQNYLMELVIVVPGQWSMQQLQPIEEAVRERVGTKVKGVRRVKIRFIAKEREKVDFSDEFIGAEISPRSSPEPEDEKEERHQDSELKKNS